MLIGKRSEYFLKSIRAKAKMFEYDIPEELHLKINPLSNDLVLLAIAIIGDISEEIWDLKEKPIIIPKEKQLQLYFSSRFFDSFFQSFLDESSNPYYIILGAVSYYYCDMIGNSRVMLKMLSSFNFDFHASGLEKAIIWLLNNEFELDISCIDNKFRIYIEEIKNAYLDFFTGKEINLVEFNKFKSFVYKIGNPREILFADIILAIFKKKISNSCLGLMPHYSGIQLSEWIETFENNNRIKEMWPAQILLGENRIFNGQSGVIQMPTSSGKTTSIALAIQSSFLSGRTTTAVIVAPFKALCKEIVYDLENFFKFDSKHIEISEFSDIPESSEFIESLLPDSNKKIIVLTPEKLLYIIKQNQTFTNDIKLIIFDEAHLFDDDSRGTDYEMLLSIINYFFKSNVQKLLVSAVLPNAEKLNEWVNNNGVVVQNKTIKTTEKNVAFNSSNLYGVHYLYFLDPIKNLEEEFYVPRVIKSLEIKRLGRETKQRFFPDLKEKHDIGIYYSIKLITKGSVAIYCPRKINVNSIIERFIDLERRDISLDVFADRCVNNEHLKIASLIFEHYGDNSISLYQAALRGILGHYSSIPNGIKVSMEYALKNGLVNCVICTSTLAQGVNLPIKYLIISNIYQSNQMIKVRDFHNLIGRTGRAGQQTEGTIILTENVYHNKSISAERRFNQYRYLFNPENSEDCGSNLLDLVNPIVLSNNREIKNDKLLSLIKERYTNTDEYNHLKHKLKSISETNDENGVGKEILRKIEQIENILISLENYIMFFADSNNYDDDIIKSTYGYFLANDEQRNKLEFIFRLIKDNLNQIETHEKAFYSKSMLGIIKIRELEKSVLDKIDDINNSDLDKRLSFLCCLLLKFGDCKIANKIQGTENILQMLKFWLDGARYSRIFNFAILNDVTIVKRNRTRVLNIEDIIELCNSDFSYVMLSLIQSTIEALRLLQGEEIVIEWFELIIKRIRYGLPRIRDIYIYELGFSDRIIAQEISAVLPVTTLDNKKAIKNALKINKTQIKEILIKYPSYFLQRLEAL